MVVRQKDEAPSNRLELLNHVIVVDRLLDQNDSIRVSVVLDLVGKVHEIWLNWLNGVIILDGRWNGFLFRGLLNMCSKIQ